MKIDFKELAVKSIDDVDIVVDISKDLGNLIFKDTQDIGELELARSIYNSGEIDVDSNSASIIKKYIDIGFKAFVKETIDPVLDKIINNK